MCSLLSLVPIGRILSLCLRGLGIGFLLVRKFCDCLVGFVGVCAANWHALSLNLTNLSPFRPNMSSSLSTIILGRLRDVLSLLLLSFE
ncbi:hypothetical protein LZ30DRAFT_789391 [Colletotrichum cereale]|nr:hypothetical protein LZ30DRAFT_789391 [Colletotrichum cereale]